MGIARSTYYGAPPANRDAESLSLLASIQSDQSLHSKGIPAAVLLITPGKIAPFRGGVAS